MISAVFHRLRRAAPACAGVLLAGAMVPGASVAQYQAPQAPGDGLTPYSAPAWGPEGGARCLQAHALSGVAASNDREVLLRFGRDIFYRVRLTRACPALLEPRAHVSSATRSTGGLICNPFDLELDIVAGDGSVSHCTGAAIIRTSAGQFKAVAALSRIHR
jgi:hypothetical protein